ncbi:MAG TPA: hypothetical protein VFA43_13775 [Gemmatimonadaceae bacterium]|nr:hypothetical protein [Gemmatimonadaceae bacterium]
MSRLALMRKGRKALNQILTVCVLVPASAQAQSPEMARLAKALAGDWSTVEVVQFGRPVAQGAGRKGENHVRLVGGGTALVSEGHTVGSVGGDLRWFTTFWWDTEIRRYRFLTCFTAADANGCELRGTAFWDGERLVNEYQERVDGVLTRMRDVWSDITATSHTLTEEHDMGHGVMKAYVVSHDTRMP